MNTINTNLDIDSTTINAIKRQRPDQGRISITGPQAELFLEGQLTCDIKALAPLHSTLGGYCNTQGRLISLFRLFKQLSDNNETEYWLDCPLDIIDSTIKTLKKYAMFSKVTIENISGNTPISSTSEPDPRSESEITQLKINDILNKIPQLCAQTQGLFLPHHVNLPQLGGVSFTKGCYLGQEIIARMEYRGKIKKHLAVLKANIPTELQSNPLKPSMPIYSTHNTQTEEPVGHIVNTQAHWVLASILDSALEWPLYVTDSNIDNRIEVNVYKQ